MELKSTNDPVVDEIREIRHRISARFGHDPQRLIEYYRKIEQEIRDDPSSERAILEKPDRTAA